MSYTDSDFPNYTRESYHDAPADDTNLSQTFGEDSFGWYEDSEEPLTDEDLRQHLLTAERPRSAPPRVSLSPTADTTEPSSPPRQGYNTSRVALGFSPPRFQESPITPGNSPLRLVHALALETGQPSESFETLLNNYIQEEFGPLRDQIAHIRFTLSRTFLLTQSRGLLVGLQRHQQAYDAATNIQRVFRGFWTRCEKQTLTDLSTYLQRIVRGHLTRSHLRKMDTGDFSFTPLRNANNDAAIGNNCIHTKDARSKLSAEHKATVFTQATAKLSGGLRFVALPLKIDDPKQLTTYQNVDTTIQAYRERLEAYDMLDVFTLVFPIDCINRPDLELILDAAGNPTGKCKSVKLLDVYSSLRVAVVALSNKFYQLWTDDATDQLHTNLNWSYLLLKNNIEPSLMARLQPKYDAFDKSERGGPLLFQLLMNELMYTNESAVKALKEQVEKYDIKKVAGEDIKRISSILLSVSKRIFYSRGSSFPEDYVDTIIRILQTTSVPAFNAQFDNIAVKRASEQADVRIALDAGQAAPALIYSNTLTTVEKLLHLASTFYDRYTREGLWQIHVKSKAVAEDPERMVAVPATTNRSALLTSTCFNCGSPDHTVPDCPTPHDSTRIDANKSKYMEEKRRLKAERRPGQGSGGRGNGSSTGGGRGGQGTNANQTDKWRPPSEGGDTQRFIHTRTLGSQPYKWNPQTQRWDIMVSIPASNHGANSGSSANTTSAPPAETEAVLNTYGSSDSGDDASALRAQLAEMQRQIQRLNDQI